MNTYQDIKQKFEAISSQLEPMLSSLPKEVSLLITLLLTMFNALFDLTSRQIKELREAIDNQTKTIDNQTNTIDNLTRQIQTLLQKLEQASGEKAELKNLVKTLKTMLRSKDVDLDAMKRLVFGGSERMKEKLEPAQADGGQAAENDQTGTAEKPAGKKKSEKRNRQSNGEKTQNCDVEINRYLTCGGDVPSSQTEEDASKEIAQETAIGGKKCRFRGRKKSGAKVETIRLSAKVTSYIPRYETEDGETIDGINPEKDFLPKTVFGFFQMADAAEERMQNRIPMNRIARTFSMRCRFIISRQLLARYFIKSAAWIRAAYETCSTGL